MQADFMNLSEFDFCYWYRFEVKLKNNTKKLQTK